MLSAAKHLCSSSQMLEPKATAEILRFAQDDRALIFSHVLAPRAIAPCGTLPTARANVTAGHFQSTIGNQQSTIGNRHRAASSFFLSAW
jgi:hypothetical protein